MNLATPRIQLVRLEQPSESREILEADVRNGLSSTPKRLPPKYFYDARGSKLFEMITRLPEYYLPRAELEILERGADEWIEATRPSELLEIGSGSSRKTRLLLEAMGRRETMVRYLALDVSESSLREAAQALTTSYPWLEVVGFVGDFDRHLAQIPRGGRRLVAFLGSTIGNLHPDHRVPFLKQIAAGLGPEDRFLLGVDLVKDVATLEAAYNDSEQVTAEFNRNVLHVLNRELGADFDVDAFEHLAWFDRERSWIEMALRPQRDMSVHISALDLKIHFSRGELMQTEISCKFTRATVEAVFEAAGLAVERWELDGQNRFALALGRPATGSRA